MAFSGLFNQAYNREVHESDRGNGKGMVALFGEDIVLFVINMVKAPRQKSDELVRYGSPMCFAKFMLLPGAMRWDECRLFVTHIGV